MTPHDTPRVPSLPEDGSTHGVHLREGAFAAAVVPEAPAPFLRGALYCVYPRAFSARGTLAGVVDELDRIAALGATAIWLLPVHPVGVAGRKGSVGCPYAVRDYRAVDPALGTVEDLRALTGAAHDRGLAVLIDLVANHAANDLAAAAEHPGWLARDREGPPTRRVAGWTDAADWDFEAEGAAAYLAESAEFWVREAGIDGYRCDVAGMVPRPFWKDVSGRLAALHPGHFLLAEWYDPELHTVGFHACYDWVLYRTLRDTAMGRTGASSVGAALDAWSANFPANAVPLRFLENHDEPRAAAIFGLERLPAYAAVAFLSGGLPFLYNGQEVGATHRPSLFEREPIDWSRPAPAVAALYRELIRLVRDEEPWGPGPAVPVATDRPATIAAFSRERGGRRGLVVANLGRDEETVTVGEAAGAGVFHRVFGSAEPVCEPGRPLRLEAGEAWAGVS
jgi:glycosidase